MPKRGKDSVQQTRHIQRKEEDLNASAATINHFSWTKLFYFLNFGHDAHETPTLSSLFALLHWELAGAETEGSKPLYLGTVLQMR